MAFNAAQLKAKKTSTMMKQLKEEKD